jgi:hypothetical protein
MKYKYIILTGWVISLILSIICLSNSFPFLGLIFGMSLLCFSVLTWSIPLIEE